MGVFEVFNLLVYKKFLILTTLYSDFGLSFNDFHFFYFEFFFITSMIIVLIFFVFLSNTKNIINKYLNVSKILLNLLPFVVIILMFLNLNNTNETFYLFNGFYYNDFSVNFFKTLLLICFFIFLFLVKDVVNNFRNYDFEFVLTLFLSIFASILLLNSNDLLGLFFVIELQSLTFYILVSSKQTSSFSTESGLKYFIIGCFSSGLILFGISLIYGFTGLISYTDLSLFLSGVTFLHNTNLYFFSIYGFAAGLILLTIGLLFKLGAVPFHMWMPDVYEGAPMIMTAYLSTIPKVSLIFIFFKLYYVVFFEIFEMYQVLFLLTAILSVILGSIAAIYQIKLKRLLTYSMITNTGYLILGLSLGDVSGIYVTLFYLISYIFIMLGLFSIFVSMRSLGGSLIKRLNTLVNLAEINPLLSFCTFILLFSIAGIPPLLGFYSKLFLFLFTLQSKMYFLTILFIILVL